MPCIPQVSAWEGPRASSRGLSAHGSNTALALHLSMSHEGEAMSAEAINVTYAGQRLAAAAARHRICGHDLERAIYQASPGWVIATSNRQHRREVPSGYG